MSTETIHPMVMKAARVFSDQESDAFGIDRNLHWDLHRKRLTLAAQSALTECGALESLQALEAYEKTHKQATTPMPRTCLPITQLPRSTGARKND